MESWLELEDWSIKTETTVIHRMSCRNSVLTLKTIAVCGEHPQRVPNVWEHFTNNPVLISLHTFIDQPFNWTTVISTRPSMGQESIY